MGGRRPRINTLPWDSDCGMARAIGALGRPHRVQPAPILVSCTAALVATTGIHGWSSAYSGIQLIALGDSIHSCGRREPFAKPALQRFLGRPHKDAFGGREAEPSWVRAARRTVLHQSAIMATL